MKKFLLSLVALLGCSTAFADNTLTLLDSNDTGWTYENVSLPEGLSYVWSYSTSYKNMTGSAYKSGTGYAAEAWAISPVIDATAASSVSMAFEHYWNYFASIEVAAQQCAVAVRLEGATSWTPIAIPTLPSAQNTTFGSTGNFDLKAYAGKKFQIGLHYVSTGENVGTWRLKNMVFTADNEIKLSGVDPEPEPTATVVNNIAAFNALASDESPLATINSTVTAVYQNGAYLYAKDNSGWLLVYSSATPDYKNGDIIPAGITGNAALYNGTPQMGNPDIATFGTATAGSAVEPIEVACEEISADMIHQYVLLKNVTISGSGRNFTLLDETGVEVALYNQFNDATRYDEAITVPTGEGYNVYGFISVYNETAQVYPTKIVSASGKEVVATPTFSPAAGAVKAGTEVTIATATEGATIYYTLDGTEPSTSSTVYAAPIVVNEAVTIKAFAAAEGMDNSAVATAEYTIKEDKPVTGDAVRFDFTAPETLTPAIDLNVEADKNGQKTIYIAGHTFSAAPVNFTIDLGASSQGGAIFYSQAGAWSCRFYKKATMTIKADEGYSLEKAEFGFEKTDGSTTMAKCTFSAGAYDTEGNSWSGDATEVVIDGVTNTSKTISITTLTVYFKDNAGVNDIEIDNNAPAVYYNPQGVRVAEPTNGLYIKVQGNKTTKVVL